jgi:hypothetical protein
MVECRAAADFLQERTDLNGDVRRALETAIPVAYVRPWGKWNTIGVLGPERLPRRPEQVELHNGLILVRNKVYAHTDEEIGARWITGMDKALGVPGMPLVPAWRPLNLDRLPEIAKLAEGQKARFLDGVFDLHQRNPDVFRSLAQGTHPGRRSGRSRVGENPLDGARIRPRATLRPRNQPLTFEECGQRRYAPRGAPGLPVRGEWF